MRIPRTPPYLVGGLWGRKGNLGARNGLRSSPWELGEFLFSGWILYLPRREVEPIFKVRRE